MHLGISPKPKLQHGLAVVYTITAMMENFQILVLTQLPMPASEFHPPAMIVCNEKLFSLKVCLKNAD